MNSDTTPRKVTVTYPFRVIADDAADADAWADAYTREAAAFRDRYDYAAQYDLPEAARYYWRKARECQETAGDFAALADRMRRAEA